MSIKSLDTYLETVTEFIFDNDKLVTYKWLSKELEIHVNVAKCILWEFWQKYRKEKSFDCVFLLMGLLPDGGMRVEVVKEKDLAVAKKKYAETLSEHIYSLQKVLPELHVLGNAEKGDVRFSAIKCFENNDRSDEEMHTLRWGAASTEIQRASQETVKPVNAEKVPESTKEKKEKSPQKKSVTTKKTNQKKGMDNLFKNISNKQKSPSSELSNTKTVKVEASNQAQESSAKKITPDTSKKNGQKGGISSFLKQGTSAEINKNSVSPEDKKPATSNVKENTEKKNISEKKTKQKTDARGKKRNRSKETNNAAKKRKRITIQSDSSDTESSEKEQDEEMEAPPSPERVSPVRTRSPSPPKVKLEGGKRKVLKMVDKTFEEDGYLVTKKVHVYESCSEEEVEVEQPKKSVTPESRQDPKGKKNTKQTTLMNFFKKS